MLKEKVKHSSSKYFETMEVMDSRKNFEDMSPWIFNFYKGDDVGCTIVAQPPEFDKKQEAFMHILNLLTFDKFDYVTVSLDTWFVKQDKDNPNFNIRPSESLEREEAIITLGASSDELEQAMLIYGRNDNGKIYEKEHITEGSSNFEGWMQEVILKAMNFPVTMEELVVMAKNNTEIFDDVKDKPTSELIHNLKQEWINLLTENNCMIAFSESCDSFNELEGYEAIYINGEEE